VTPLRSPYPYPGGKSRVAHLVWDRLGDVSYFVEPFFGSGAVLLARPHRGCAETVNDADCQIANFWRAIRDAPKEVALAADWPINEADLIARHSDLHSRAEALRHKVLADPRYNDPQIAGWWVWGLCQWIGSGWCSDHLVRSRPLLDRGGRGIHSRQRTSRREAGALRKPRNNRAKLGIPEQADILRTTRAAKGVHKKPRVMHQGNGILSNRGAGGQTGVNRSRIHLDALVSWLEDLQARLRRVRVLCGDFERTLTPGTTIGRWASTGVFLDPPYDPSRRRAHLYNHDESDVAARVRAWCAARGDHPQMRICLCGLEGEHSVLEELGWSVVNWTRQTGSASSSTMREAMWFSPHCLSPTAPQQLPLFDEQADGR